LAAELGEDGTCYNGGTPGSASATSISTHRTVLVKVKLFGFDKAKTAIPRGSGCGSGGYFDAIALHAAGITNVVASLGTALRPSTAGVALYRNRRWYLVTLTQLEHKQLKGDREIASLSVSCEFSTYQRQRVRMNTMPHQNTI